MGTVLTMSVRYKDPLPSSASRLYSTDENRKIPSLDRSAGS